MKFTVKFNINDDVRVRLTDIGRRILDKDGSLEFVKTDKDGWSTFQFWVLMEIFGKYIYNGCSVPFKTEIEII